MSTETSTGLRMSRVIQGNRKSVFKAWTDPAEMKNWCSPEGIDVQECTVDLRVGGAYRIHMLTPEGKTHTAIGRYRVVEPPSRLVYTWDWEEEGAQMGDTLVTVEFKEMGEATEIVLTHEKFPNEEARDGHDMGWKSCLNRLEALLA